MSAIHQAILASYAPAGGSSPFGGLVSTTDLVDWWPLSEASGTRVGVHAGLNLTDNNTVTGSAGGGPDGSDASQFTAANSEYLSRASEAALQTGDIDWSIILWAYLDSKGATRSFMAKDGWTTGNREFNLFFSSSTDRLRLQVLNGVTTLVGDVSATTFGSPPLSTWMMVHAYHSATSNEVGISVNGGTVNTAATTGAMGTSTVDFQLGASGVTRTNFMNGRIQRAGFFKRLISGTDISNFYNSGNGLDY